MKAYQLLAQKHKLSNRSAKNLIEDKRVYVNNKRLKEASKEIDKSTNFYIISCDKPRLIYEDNNILAISKPPLFDSYDLEKIFKPHKLLHRLDKDTSGIILMYKDIIFKENTVKEFKNHRVYKEYLALINGMLDEEIIINKSISVKNNRAFIDPKGREAITIISPFRLINKYSLVKVIIKTGRTHQIRLHLNAINRPIIGDEIYGGNCSIKFPRLMLHANKISLLNYSFSDENNPDFFKYLS